MSIRTLTTALIIAATAFSSAIHLPANAAPEVATAPPHPAAKQDLPNYHEVYPYLYRGGEPTDAGLEQLKKMGVEKIIDLRGAGPIPEAEKKEVEKLGMRYLNLPMDFHAPTKDQVQTFLQSIEEAKENKGDKRAVFVHCQHGSDRTGCMVGIWRVTHDGWNYEEAYKEMRKYYFTPKFTHLSGAVKEYEERAHQSKSK